MTAYTIHLLMHTLTNDCVTLTLGLTVCASPFFSTTLLLTQNIAHTKRAAQI